MKSKKGITLIALVITIIILIILAGVSVAILGGENGLIEKTKEAGRKQKMAEVEEKINLELMAAETDAIIRGEQLEVAQRNDIASKYGTVNGDILTIDGTDYQIDLKQVYNKTLSESGSYTALKQAYETSEANLATAQMSQSEASQQLTQLQTTLNTMTATPDDILSSKTIYDPTDGTVKNGTITASTSPTINTTAATGTQEIEITPGYYNKISINQTSSYDAGKTEGQSAKKTVTMSAAASSATYKIWSGPNGTGSVVANNYCNGWGEVKNFTITI